MADADYINVAKQFVDFYYTTFDGDRSSLKALYRPNSMLTFESAQVLGQDLITEKLVSLPFQKVKHVINTQDAQPSTNGGIVILITGQLLVDEEQRPMNFSQVFQLMRDETGTYFLFNDLFKLIFG